MNYRELPAPNAAPRSTSSRSKARSVLTCAVAVPLMVVTGLAMLAIIPLCFLVRGTYGDPQLKRLRPWAVSLAGIYAIPLALWALLPDRAPSLTKDMHPGFVPVIVAAALAFIVVYAHGRLTDTRPVRDHDAPALTGPVSPLH